MSEHVPIWRQIMIGSAVLSLCALVHIANLVGGLHVLRVIDEIDVGPNSTLVRFMMIVAAFGVVLLGHTFQVWIWALTFRLSRALQSLDDAVYFALVTTTTLGYGDITLEKKWRIFGAMGAVSGLLTYGLSTAFLIGLMEALLRK